MVSTFGLAATAVGAWWHFNALDGDPTFEAAIHEQTLQIRGEQAVAEAVRIKRIRKSTNACENVCYMLHPDPATLSSQGCRPFPEESDVTDSPGCNPGEREGEETHIQGRETLHPVNPYRREQELPVSKSPVLAEVAAERVGVKLPTV